MSAGNLGSRSHQVRNHELSDLKQLRHSMAAHPLALSIVKMLGDCPAENLHTARQARPTLLAVSLILIAHFWFNNLKSLLRMFASEPSLPPAKNGSRLRTEAKGGSGKLFAKRVQTSFRTPTFQLSAMFKPGNYFGFQKEVKRQRIKG